jgi:hypothetical protein
MHLLYDDSKMFYSLLYSLCIVGMYIILDIFLGKLQVKRMTQELRQEYSDRETASGN